MYWANVYKCVLCYKQAEIRYDWTLRTVHVHVRYRIIMLNKETSKRHCEAWSRTVYVRICNDNTLGQLCHFSDLITLSKRSHRPKHWKYATKCARAEAQNASYQFILFPQFISTPFSFSFTYCCFFPHCEFNTSFLVSSNVFVIMLFYIGYNIHCWRCPIHAQFRNTNCQGRRPYRMP